MKRVLIVKLTSLGDVIHTLPAITDAIRAYPSLEIDWIVDQSFQEVASFHPAVKKIYPTSHRKWLRNWRSPKSYRAVYQLVKDLRKTHYDLIIDAQGNYKSSFLTLASRGKKAGMNRSSLREPIAAISYNHRYEVPKGEHAIWRLRRLFSLALSYPTPTSPIDYQIDRSCFIPYPAPEKYVTFIHSASWQTKLWPEGHWIKLIEETVARGYKVLLPWGSAEEEARAKRLQISKDAIVLPRLSLKELGFIIEHASAVVSMDTGLSHLAAALNIPTITLYGATHSGLIGTSGQNQIHLQSSFPCSPCRKKSCPFSQEAVPCLASLTPDKVFQHLLDFIKTF